MQRYVNYKSATVVTPPGAAPRAIRLFYVAIDRIRCLTKLDQF
jgi:hypothetical protein